MSPLDKIHPGDDVVFVDVDGRESIATVIRETATRLIIRRRRMTTKGSQAYEVAFLRRNGAEVGTSGNFRFRIIFPVTPSTLAQVNRRNIRDRAIGMVRTLHTLNLTDERALVLCKLLPAVLRAVE